MEYTLKLSQQDVQLIVNALAELPLKVAANTYSAIQKQVSDQDAKNAVPLDGMLSQS